MKDTKKKIEKVNGITIDKVKPYENYVVVLHVKDNDKIIEKERVFMKTNEGIVAMIGFDENVASYGKPNKIKISEKNNSIRVATKEDIKRLVKRSRMVSMK